MNNPARQSQTVHRFPAPLHAHPRTNTDKDRKPKLAKTARQWFWPGITLLLAVCVGLLAQSYYSLNKENIALSQQASLSSTDTTLLKDSIKKDVQVQK